MRHSLAFGVVGLTAAAVVAAYALWPRATSPEAQVRAAVGEMERGLGERDAARVLDRVSEQFHSSTLGDRSELRRLVLGQLLRGGGLRVVTLQADVVAEEDGRLRWRGRVAAARAGGAGLAAVTDAELRQFQVEALFAGEQGHWRLVDATVTPLE
jgi:hypothetical protein